MSITVAMRTQVSQLYVSLFGRAPDGEGLGYWVGQLAAGKTVAQVAQDMFNVDAARAYYPSFLTNDEIVAAFYVNVLGRTADAEGQAYWVGEMNKAGATKGSVITDMINAVVNYTGSDAAGVTSKALFVNKVEVAQYYGEKNGNVAGATAALSGVTDVAATVAAAKATVDAGANPGQTFPLTAGADTLSPTSATAATKTTAGNDLFRAPTDGFLTSADFIDGGDGTDTLTYTQNAAATASIVNNAPSLSSIEVVKATIDGSALAGPGGATFSGVNSTGLQQVWSVNSIADSTEPHATTFTASGISTAVTVGIEGGAAETAGAAHRPNFTAVFNSVTGTADSANLVLLNASAATATIAGIETLNVSSTGTATAGNTIATLTAANLSKLVVTGSANLTITNGIDFADNASATAIDGVIDASAFTGKLNVQIGGTDHVDVIGGTNNDRFNFGATLTKEDKVDGGDGTDTLALTTAHALTVAALSPADNAALKARVTNIERLELTDANADTNNLDVSKVAGLSSYVVMGGAVTGGFTLSNVANAGTVQLNAAAAAVTASLTVGVKDSAVAGNNTDAVTISLSGAHAGATIDYADVTVANVETINVVSSTRKTTELVAADVNRVGITAANAQEIKISGATNVVIDKALNNASLAKIDASAATGTVTVSAQGATQGIAITGGSKADTLVGGNGSDLISGGAGNDTIRANGTHEVQTLTYSAITAIADDATYIITVVVGGQTLATAAFAATATNAQVATAIHTLLTGNSAAAVALAEAGYTFSVSTNVVTINAPAVLGNVAEATSTKGAGLTGGVGTAATTSQAGKVNAANIMTGGEGKDTFEFGLGGDSSVTKIQTITDLNLGGTQAQGADSVVDQIKINGATVAATVVELTAVQQTAVTEAATLAAAVNLLTNNALSATGATAQFNYGGDTYLLYTGANAGGDFAAADDLLVKITGVAGTLSANDIVIA